MLRELHLKPTLRRATADDLRFVHSSWHTNFWKVWGHKHMQREHYNAGMDRRIDLLLHHGLVMVAFFPEVPDEVLGWSCIVDETLHYVYVKATYRRAGIGSGLTQGLVKWYTHPTNEVGRAFMARIGAQFNPFKMES